MRRSDFYNRKRMVHVTSCTVFIIATLLISYVFAKWHKNALSWLTDSVLTQGTVVSLENRPTGFNRLLNQARFHTAFAISYSVEIDHKLIIKHTYVDQAVYTGLVTGQAIPVYVSRNGQHTRLKVNADNALAQSHVIYYVAKTAIITVPVFLIIHALLMLLFIRAYANTLPKGFYSERSWLNTQDNCLVWLSNDQIVSIAYQKNEAPTLAKMYQNNASLDELIATLKRPKLTTIELNDICAVKSEYASSKIVISTIDKTFKLGFINYGLKHHALTHITRQLPPHLIHSVNKTSRIVKFFPWFCLSMVCILTVIEANNHTLTLIIAAVLIIKLLPKCIFHVFSPTEVQQWHIPDI